MERATIVNLCKLLIGTPYVWGGSKPYDGLDCSGLVMFCFHALGLIKENDDYTADALYDVLLKDGKIEPRVTGIDHPKNLIPGNLVFYGTPQGISHVAVVIDMNGTCISARGGTKDMDREGSIRVGAGAKKHKWDYRIDTCAIGDVAPFLLGVYA